METYFNKNNKNLVILILTLAIIWLIYCFIFNTFNYTFGIVFSFLYILFFLFQSPEKKYYIILFSLPFASIFKIGSGLPSSMIVLYTLFIIHILIKNNIGIKKIDYLFLIIIVLFQFITIPLYQGSVLNLLSFVLNIIFMKVCILSMIQLNNKSLVLYNSTFIYSAAMCLSVVAADMFPGIPYIVSKEKQTILMSIDRFSGLNTDPNYYSQLVLVAICLVIASLLVKQKKLRLLGLLICLFLIISGFRSISKSYALSIIVIVVSSFYYFITSIHLSSYKGRLKKILISIVFLTLGIISLILVIQEFVVPVFEKRTETDLLTGRGDIWKDYLKLLVLKPEILLTGVGFSNDANILGKELGVYMAPHNIYLEVIVGCGVIGSFLLFLLFRDLFKYFKYTIQSPYFMFFIIILFTSFGLSLSSNDAFFILLPLIILFRIGANSNEKTSDINTYTSERWS